jgi:orotidine-5'-phosphate decarboxylase
VGLFGSGPAPRASPPRSHADDARDRKDVTPHPGSLSDAKKRRPERIATLACAIREGADMVVIGRLIQVTLPNLKNPHRKNAKSTNVNAKTVKHLPELNEVP